MFNFPYGLDVIDENNVIVSDSDNHSLRLVTITGKDENVKTRSSEGKQSKLLKGNKVPEDACKLVIGPSISSSAFEMLQSSARYYYLHIVCRESAKKITASIIEILLSYTSNPAKQTLCGILSLVHLLLTNEKKKYETSEDIQLLLKKTTLKEDISNLRAENIQHQNSILILKQLAILKKNDDCKVFVNYGLKRIASRNSGALFVACGDGKSS